MRKGMLLFFPLLLLACDQTPTAPVTADGPAYNWMNNPDIGNVRVTRFESHIAICWTDAATGLRACHSTVPLGGGTEPDCGPQELLDPVARQEIGVFDPADVFGSWLRVNQNGEAWITVRDVTTPGTCFGNRLVAQGWGTFHYTDNDLYGSNGTDPNANAWGYMTHGVLPLADGSATGSYNGHSRFRYNDAAGIRVLAARAAIH